jgi:hypothetical protein
MKQPRPNTRLSDKKPTSPWDWYDACTYASLFPLYFWIWVLV